MIQLSYRLKTVANLVGSRGRVADVGCDHAYISIYLIQSHLAVKVIAMDVNKGPLERAKDNISRCGLEGKIETRLSDGALKLQQGEVETLLIAGMGGALTIKILSDSSSTVTACKELVLQPQSEILLVRKYIRSIGFTIEKEEMLVDEGKYYTAMRCIKENVLLEETREVFDRYGKYLLESKNQVLKEYLNKGYNQSKKLLEELAHFDTDQVRKRAKTLNEDLDYIIEGLNYYEM